MTEITMSEIKILTIQIILMALLGAFMLLYASSPIVSISFPTSAANNQTSSVSASDQSWISNIISIPTGMDVLFLISALIISPFLFFDAFIALRFAKDIATKWI